MLLSVTIQRDIQTLGGLAATHELLGLGHTRPAIRGAVGRKRLIRVRKGWYCVPSLPMPYQAAARVGGRLTCVSLAQQLGLWIPEGVYGLHVAVAENACQLRSVEDYHQRLANGVVVHWDDEKTRGPRFATDLSSALVRCCSCMDLESAFVLCESARFQRRLSRPQWADLLAQLPAAIRPRLSTATSLSESGSESMFSFRSGVFGIRVRQQVWLRDDRVDFLLGDRLVVEIDSVAHHDPTKDAIRDARLSILGYRVLRFMYSQIVNDWPSVMAAILAAISRGDHLPG